MAAAPVSSVPPPCPLGGGRTRWKMEPGAVQQSATQPSARARGARSLNARQSTERRSRAHRREAHKRQPILQSFASAVRGARRQSLPSSSSTLLPTWLRCHRRQSVSTRGKQASVPTLAARETRHRQRPSRWPLGHGKLGFDKQNSCKRQAGLCRMMRW
jgi:hypothetical protein